MITEPGIYTIPLDEYIADPCESPSLNPGVAATLLARSPLHAWTEHPRLNPTHQREHSEAFDLGAAFHSSVLGGPLFHIISAPDYRTKAAQEARVYARANGWIPILRAQADQVAAM